MLLGSVGTSLLGNMFTSKGIVTTGEYGKKEQGIVRAGYGSKDH